jgi:RNA polymerase sigma factor (TIGR02999 family)
MNPSQDTIVRLIAGLGRGDRDSVDELFELVYDELKALAHRQRLRWREDRTMNTTALVHEVYMKLVGQARVDAGGHAHFQALAARAMRHVLCNYARGRRALKRSGANERLSLDDADGLQPVGAPDDLLWTEDQLCALDAALVELEKKRPRASRVVECRFFGDLTIEETAAAVGASERTVKRDWTMAQAWLHRELGAGVKGEGQRGDR